jgi:hypothetical protein
MPQPSWHARYRMEMMPKDFTQFLLTIAISLVIGLAIGALVRFRFRQFGDRVKTWAESVPWWFYAFGAVLMVALALANASLERWTFTAFLIGMAILDIYLTVKAWRLRSRPLTHSTQVGSSCKMPDQ